MKVITCASYFGSGSSALTDMVSEYEGVKNLGDYEFRFLHDIDGVSDLEFHLCECHNRHNSGHALKRFEKLSKFNSGTWFNKRYEPFFGNHYMEYTEQYIHALIDSQFRGWWFYDLYDKGVFNYYILQECNRVLRKLSRGKKSILSNEVTYCSHPSVEKFLKCTNEYVGKLLAASNSENAPYLVIDQLVSSQNIGRILRYIPGDKAVFVVDRDPRDIYILNKCYRHEHLCPVDDAREFCDWFLYTRQSGANEILDTSVVMKLKFEDFIYNYKQTKICVESFLGLDSSKHVYQFKKMNPKRSVKNTQLWKVTYGLKADIEIIEKELSAYLYDFDNKAETEIPGIIDTNSEIF